MNYFDYNSRVPSPPPSDCIDFDPEVVLEGEAAEGVIQRFMAAQEARRSLELLPLERR